MSTSSTANSSTSYDTAYDCASSPPTNLSSASSSSATTTRSRRFGDASSGSSEAKIGTRPLDARGVRALQDLDRAPHRGRIRRRGQRSITPPLNGSQSNFRSRRTPVAPAVRLPYIYIFLPRIEYRGGPLVLEFAKRRRCFDFVSEFQSQKYVDNRSKRAAVCVRG